MSNDVEAEKAKGMITGLKFNVAWEGRPIRMTDARLFNDI